DEPRANREEQIFSPVLSDAPLLAERGGAERHVAAAPRAAMQVEGGDNTSPGRVARDCGIPFPLRSTESSTATAVDASRRKARSSVARGPGDDPAASRDVPPRPHAPANQEEGPWVKRRRPSTAAWEATTRSVRWRTICCPGSGRSAARPLLGAPRGRRHR